MIREAIWPAIPTGKRDPGLDRWRVGSSGRPELCEYSGDRPGLDQIGNGLEGEQVDASSDDGADAGAVERFQRGLPNPISADSLRREARLVMTQCERLSNINFPAHARLIHID